MDLCVKSTNPEQVTDLLVGIIKFSFQVRITTRGFHRYIKKTKLYMQERRNPTCAEVKKVDIFAYSLDSPSSYFRGSNICLVIYSRSA